MSDKPVYSIEQAMDKVGGLGRYNILLFFVLNAHYGICSVYTYNLSFLTMMPKFKCADGFEGDCTNKVVCEYPDFKDNPRDYIDYNSRFTLDNWIEQMELWCEPGWLIGMFGTAYLLGFAFSSLFL